LEWSKIQCFEADLESLPPDDDRSSEAAAYGWAWRVITISAGMVFPGIVGILLDRWLGFRALFVLLGFGLGMGLGIWQLAQLSGKQR
jgi:F0F1-type ATP synthase assembly protein I